MSASDLVYIMGYGHSGSTVLNIVLAQHPDIHGAGELSLLPRAWLNGEYCSCGSKVSDCELWRAVVERWRGAVAIDPIPAHRALQAECERTSEVLRGWRPSPARQGRLERYGELTRSLLEAIRDVTGKRVVVDSSKRAARGQALSTVPGVNLRLVHLVRDGRGVAWSMRRSLERNAAAGVQRAKRPQPAARTSLAWVSANLMSEALCRRLGGDRSLRLRYEDFVTDSQGALAAIGSLAGLDFTDVARQLAEGEPFPPGHVVAGNRLRMAGPVSLRYDAEWQTRLPATQRTITEWLCGPLLRRYGYE